MKTRMSLNATVVAFGGIALAIIAVYVGGDYGAALLITVIGLLMGIHEQLEKP